MKTPWCVCLFVHTSECCPGRRHRRLKCVQLRAGQARSLTSSRWLSGRARQGRGRGTPLKRAMGSWAPLMVVSIPLEERDGSLTPQDSKLSRSSLPPELAKTGAGWPLTSHQAWQRGGGGGGLQETAVATLGPFLGARQAQNLPKLTGPKLAFSRHGPALGAGFGWSSGQDLYLAWPAPLAGCSCRGRGRWARSATRSQAAAGAGRPLHIVTLGPPRLACRPALGSHQERAPGSEAGADSEPQ